MLATLKARAGIIAVLGRSTSTVRQLDLDFVTHEEALVVFGDGLFSSFHGIKLDEAITEPKIFQPTLG